MHGQVATSWVRVARANRIYIVDDETAADPFISKIFKGIAPAGTKVEVWDLETACTKVKLVEEHEKIKALILTKTPLEFLAMAKAGIHFPKIVVGNMGKTGDRILLNNGFLTHANAEEREAFRELAHMGIDVKLHMIPDGPSIPILNVDGMKQ